VISYANPLTYEVDGLRGLMLLGGASAFGLGADLAVLLAITALLVVVGGRIYPRVVT
jgi:ABC-2 type transport system permease protein